MVEFALLVSLLFVLLVVLIFIWGESKESIGRERSQRESAEDKFERISRGIKKLTGPRPSRSVLVKHWERRLRKATGRDVDPSLPDSESRGD